MKDLTDEYISALSKQDIVYRREKPASLDTGIANHSIATIQRIQQAISPLHCHIQRRKKVIQTA